MNEAGTWKVIKALLAGFDPVRVENPVCRGTPDVNCTLGWIELKYKPREPRNPEAVFKIDHFTPQQRAWLARRWNRGGPCWVLARIGDTYLIWDGLWAAMNLGKVSYTVLVREALASWKGTPPRDELIAVLNRGTRVHLSLWRYCPKCKCNDCLCDPHSKPA